MTAPVFRRYLFVGGLHRTGTSLIAKLLASHPEIDAITDAPVPENEGAYLQGAIPHTARHGIPGHFATDPEQHLVEQSRFDTLEVRRRIEHDWNPWFSGGGSWRIEKSPVNLTRMRLYQQLFPLSQFVVVLRHPEAMAAALAKWTDNPAPALIDYALAAYDLACRDLDYLHAAMVVRYEDLVADPEGCVGSVARFCGLDPVEVDSPVYDGNRDYAGAVEMTRAQAARAAAYGYAPGLQVTPVAPRVQHPLRSLREAALRHFDIC
ncbi:sulfotransferase family protein [Aurantiacibacter odishensis]|uniref:sulfotransferase family protein n=1 Tax=Aurantiacibacter odishensis TaxID=1155476 RepID=UPI000E712A94|nr:sulfotransferase [Aurantiacibacter odishensis]